VRFQRRSIADLPDLRRLLSASGRTVLRALEGLGYHTSFSHTGRYYTLQGIPRFDALGLWFCEDIGFSAEGTLRATIVRLVEHTPAGYTHEELSSVLRLRVHDTLLDLVEAEGGSPASRSKAGPSMSAPPSATHARSSRSGPRSCRRRARRRRLTRRA